jgi:hypothetical protein
MNHTETFPKIERFRLAKRIEDSAFDFYEELIRTVKSRDKRECLLHAGLELDKLRLYLRLAHQRKLMGHPQYMYAAESLTEIGKLLGGWGRQSACCGAARGTTMVITCVLRIGTGTIHPTSTTWVSVAPDIFSWSFEPECAAFTDAARVLWKRVLAVPVQILSGRIQNNPPPWDASSLEAGKACTIIL